MAEGDTFARDTHIANHAVDDLAPRRPPSMLRLCHRRRLLRIPPPRRTITSFCRPRAPLYAWLRSPGWRAAAGELNVFTNNKLLVQEVLRV